MKKIISTISILIISIGLMACTAKETKPSKPKKPKVETVAPEKVIEETVQTRTFAYERGTEVKQKAQETITYKGKEIQTVDVQLIQPFDETTKANLAQYDLETVKPEVIATLEQDATLSQLLGKEGMTVSFDVTPEYDLLIKMTIDLKTVNLEELKKIENFSYDFAGLENTTAKRYIASLEVRGATEMTP